MGEKRVRLCCRGNKAPRRPAWRRNNRRRSRGHTTPYGAMPRRRVPLVRRLSETRVRDSAAVHAQHRSVPWPVSFLVPRKNIAGRRNHNARPVLRDRDRRRTAKCVGGNLTHLRGDSRQGASAKCLLAAERRIDSSTSSTPARPRANGWPGRRQSIRADGVPRSRHIRPRRLTRPCLPSGGERR